MTRPTIQGLQDLLKSDIQAALLGEGVDLPLDTGDGQENLTFHGAQNGEALTATASFAGLSTPTFSGLSQIVKHTTISAIKTASPKAALGTGASCLQVSIDTKGQTLTEIELDVDPQLSSLLGDPNLPSSLTLSSANLSLAIDPQQKSYTLTAGSSGEWTIVKGLSLDSLGLEVTGTTSAAPAFTLDADVSLAGVDIKLSAARAADKEAPGWKFSGELGEGQTISLSGIVEDLQGKLGVPLPSFASGVTLDKLALDFDTGTKDFSFTSEFEGAQSPVDFDLEIGADEGRVVFTFHNPEGASINIQNLVTAFLPKLASDIPNITISLQDAVFIRTGDPSSKMLFGIDIDGGIDLSSLSGLPIVGSELAGDKTVKLSSQIVAASDNFTTADLQPFQKQLGELYTTLPATISEGVSVASSLKLGDKTEPVELPLTADSNGIQSGSSSGAHWFKVEKSFGPIHLDEVGVGYENHELELLLKANMALGGLSISLDGLGVSSPLSPVKPEFHLDGLGIAFAMDPVEIGGAFRQRTENGITVYEGAAVLEADLGAEKLGLHAIGSYADDNGHPSLFLYAFLDLPLGGPPFLFVEGLGAGFGYNRALIVPDIESLSDFPLVAEALNDTGSSTTNVADLAATLTKELDGLDKYIPPQLGAGFLAVGLKFSSFKMLDSFALVTVAIGNGFEMDLIGVSDLQIPCGEDRVDPLAELRMILKASFVPTDGFFGVAAALDKSSYILSKQCTLTGGFAAYAWFAGEHAGDFVVTLGGYNPAFKVPSHYPQVPRLGLNWRVDDSIVIKGGEYFALCSHALMAGGDLEASYHLSKVHASFSVGADFLISWLPYHYDIEAHASIRASVGALSAHVGADLHLWGPAFGGKVKIKVVVIKVTIKFGDQGSTAAAPIDWSTFQNKFLPDEKKRCGITVQSGLVRQLQAQVDNKPEDLYVVNPKQFAIATDSFFPTNKAIVDGADQNITDKSFGIRPMGVSASDLTSQHTITLSYDEGGSGWQWDSYFSVTPLRRKAPSGLWGDPVVNDNQLQPPKVDDPPFVVDKGLDPVSGFQIVPKLPPTPGHTADILRSALRYDPEVLPGYYAWQTLPSFQPSTDDDATRRATLQKTIATNPTRDKILSALGVDPTEAVQIDPLALDASLVFAPQVA